MSANGTGVPAHRPRAPGPPAASRDDRPAVGPFRFRPPRPCVVVRPRQFLYASPKNTISASASGESRSRRQLTRSLLPPDRRGNRSASPVEDMAAPSRVDRLFEMLRASMRGKIFKYIERKQSSAEWRKRLPKLAERLEEILYRKFPNRNGYYNMMKGPFEPHLQFAIKTLSAQNQGLHNLKMTRDAASSSGTMISIVNHDALCQQSASLLADRSDTQNNDADEHNRTGTGFQQHQPMADMAALSGVDQQFVMLRTAMRETIFNYIGRKQSSAEWRKRLPELAKRLEEILYRKFPNKNDYYNMMKGPVEPQLQFAIKALSAQNLKNQQTPQMARDAASSSGAMIPDLNHGDVSEQPASLPADMQNNNVDKLDRTGEIL